MYQIYCLNYNNEVRKNKMEKIFNELGLDCFFYGGVDFSDERISKYDDIIHSHTKKVWSCMYGHIDMIYKFYYNTDKEIGIFCEDDIYIHKDFKNHINNIIIDFNELKIDILLLGYLLPFKLEPSIHYWGFDKKNVNNIENNMYNYYSYPNDVWGTQMYMLNRKYAKYILDKYSNDYAMSTLTNSELTPFSADWIITKDGNKALIQPMLAVEDNKINYEHDGQMNFHTKCHQINLTDDFIVF
jgi:GR25 family glycosyltransferase involved in LPS biosynthesis